MAKITKPVSNIPPLKSGIPSIKGGTPSIVRRTDSFNDSVMGGGAIVSPSKLDQSKSVMIDNYVNGTPEADAPMTFSTAMSGFLSGFQQDAKMKPVESFDQAPRPLANFETDTTNIPKGEQPKDTIIDSTNYNAFFLPYTILPKFAAHTAISTLGIGASMLARGADVGDWRLTPVMKFIGDIFIKTLSYGVDSSGTLGERLSNDFANQLKGTKTEEIINKGFEFIDDFIGDGKDVQSNWFADPVEHSMNVANLYMQQNTGNKTVDYLLDQSADVIGSGFGSVGAAMVTGNIMGATGITAIAPRLSKILMATSMTMGEGHQIGHQVAQEVTQDLLKRNPEYKAEYDKTFNEARAGIKKESPSFTDKQVNAAAKMYVDGYMKNKAFSNSPELEKEINAQAAEAAYTAQSINALGIILNLGIAGKVLNNTVTRDLLTVPRTLGRTLGSRAAIKEAARSTGRELVKGSSSLKGAKELVFSVANRVKNSETFKEGIQEYFEEGGTNWWGEQAGKKVVLEHENYSAKDAVKDFFSKESFEQGMWGMFGGMVQNKVTQEFNYSGNKKKYDAQQEEIKKLEKLFGPNQSYEELKAKTNFLATNAETNQILTNIANHERDADEKLKKAAEVENKGDNNLAKSLREEASIALENSQKESDKLMTNISLNAYKTGTAGVLLDYLEAAKDTVNVAFSSQDQQTPEAQKEKLKRTRIIQDKIDDIKSLEKEFNDNINSINRSDLYHLRSKSNINKRNVNLITDHINNTLKREADEEIKKILRRNNKFLLREDGSTVSYDIDNLFDHGHTGEDKKIYERFLNHVGKESKVGELKTNIDVKNQMLDTIDSIEDEYDFKKSKQGVLETTQLIEMGKKLSKKINSNPTLTSQEKYDLQVSILDSYKNKNIRPEVLEQEKKAAGRRLYVAKLQELRAANEAATSTLPITNTTGSDTVTVLNPHRDNPLPEDRVEDQPLDIAKVEDPASEKDETLPDDFDEQEDGDIIYETKTEDSTENKTEVVEGNALADILNFNNDSNAPINDDALNSFSSSDNVERLRAWAKQNNYTIQQAIDTLFDSFSKEDVIGKVDNIIYLWKLAFPEDKTNFEKVRSYYKSQLNPIIEIFDSIPFDGIAETKEETTEETVEEDFSPDPNKAPNLKTDRVIAPGKRIDKNDLALAHLSVKTSKTVTVNKNTDLNFVKGDEVEIDGETYIFDEKMLDATTQEYSYSFVSKRYLKLNEEDRKLVSNPKMTLDADQLLDKGVITEEHITEKEVTFQYESVDLIMGNVEAGDFTESQRLLSPHNFQIGTKLTGKHEADKVGGFPVTTSRGEKMTYGEWLIKYGPTATEDQRIGMMPIRIFDKNNIPIGWMRSTDYYNNENVSTDIDIKLAQQKVIDAKKRVMQNGQSTFTITYKSRGSHEALTVSAENSIPLTQANPNSKLGVVVNGNIVMEDGSLMTKLEDTSSPGNYYVGKLVEGSLVDMRLQVIENGRKHFMPVELKRNVNNQEADIIVNALKLAFSNDTQSLIEGVEFESLAGLKASGSNLGFNDKRLSLVFNQFLSNKNDGVISTAINLFKNSQSKSVNELKNTIGQALLNNSDTFNGERFTFNNARLVVYGTIISKETGEIKINIINKFDNYNDTYMNEFPKKIEDFRQHLLSSYLSTSFEKLKDSSAKVLSVNASGVVEVQKPYSSHIRENAMSNVKSFNIGTENKPEYVYNIQPVIYLQDESEEQKTDPSEVRAELNKVEELNKDTQDDLLANDVFNGDVMVDTVIGQMPKSEFDILQDTYSVYNPNNLTFDDWLIDMNSPNEQEENALNSLTQISNDQLEEINKDQISISNTEFQGIQEMIMFLSRYVISEIKTNQSIDILKIKELLDKAFNDNITTQNDILANRLKNLIGATNLTNSDRMQKIIDEIQKVKNIYTLATMPETKSIIIIKSLKSAFLEAGFKLKGIKNINEIDKFFRVEDVSSEIEDETDEDEDQNDNDTNATVSENEEFEKNFSKSSLEDDPKKSLPAELKALFSKVKMVDKKGNPVKGISGLDIYYGYDEVYKTVMAILNADFDIVNNMEEVIRVLTNAQKDYPFTTQVLDLLQTASQKTKNQFLYNLRQSVTYKYVMIKETPVIVDGVKVGTRNFISVYSASNSETSQKIFEEWKNSFENSKLFNFTESGVTVNHDKVNEFLKAYAVLAAKENKTAPENSEAFVNEVVNLFQSVGIKFYPETIKKLLAGDVFVDKNNKKVITSFEDQFNTKNGKFSVLRNGIAHLLSTDKNVHYVSGTASPFQISQFTAILKGLSKVQTVYSPIKPVSSIRSNGKTYTGFPPKTMLSELFSDLQRNDFSVIDNSVYQAGSLLRQWMENETFKSHISVEPMSNDSLRRQGQKSSKESDIASSSDTDYWNTVFGLFFSMTDSKLNQKFGNTSIRYRVASFLFPALSDKSTFISMRSPAFDLNFSDVKLFDFTDGKFTFIHSDLINLVYDQLVVPELARIKNHHQQALLEGVSPNDLENIQHYNSFAQLFNSIPELNKIGNENGLFIHQIAQSMKAGKSIANILIDFKAASVQVLEKLISQEVNDLLEVRDNNQIKINDAYNGDKNKRETSFENAMVDFVINNMIAKANIDMTFVGDPALFGVKLNNADFQIDEKTGLPVYTLPIDNKIEVYDNVMTKQNVNIAKRLAQLIAPGNELANSKGKKYIQVFVEDLELSVENIEFLIESFNGKLDIEAYEKVKDEDKLKYLATTYPYIADYLNIESTDGQEYITIHEALKNIFGQGKLEQEEFDRLIGIANSSNPVFSQEEKQLIINTFKPVAAGFVKSQRGVNRNMYVKSSALVLFPEVTKGRQINELRLQMERAEKETGHSVRVAYKTAVKVGLPTQSLSIFDSEGNISSDLATKFDTIIKEVTDVKSLTNSENISSVKNGSWVMMEGGNFRIQQATPTKNKTEIKYLTQLLKLMFGDGVVDITEDMFKGMNGQQLHDYHQQIMFDYIDSQKRNLYNTLSLGKNGESRDPLKTINKLKELLQDEADTSSFNNSDLKALDIEYNPVTKTFDFNMPLWMQSNSTRYEKLLMSIINNRLNKLTLPGHAFIAASNAGFKNVNDLTAEQESTIIWVDPTKMQGLNDPAKSKVLIPSKMRIDGKLVDLMQKDENGKFIYITENRELEDGSIVAGYSINKEMFDEDLFTITSTRIPTSGHMSSGVVQIAGFLPNVSDVMYVPSHLIPQKGLDFDVDKEYTLLSHLVIDNDGKIRKISYDFISSLEKENQQYREQVKANLEASNAIKAYNESLYEKAKNEENKTKARALYNELKVNASERKERLNDVALIRERINNNLSIIKEYGQKARENELVNIYTAVLGHSSMRSRVAQTVNTSLAKASSEAINGNVKNKKLISSLLSTYQRSIAGAGNIGKVAIGTYSNFMVTLSLMQQNPQEFSLGEDIVFGYLVNENGKLAPLTSLQENKPGKKNEKRRLSVIGMEKQNTATDNQKLKILDSVGINEFTIGVDAMMYALGIDTVHVDSINQDLMASHLLLSQPIIKEYSDKMRNSGAVSTAYDPDLSNKILEELQEKYGFVLFDTDPKLLTGQNLFNNLNSDSLSNPNLNAAVLSFFLKMNIESAKINSFIGILNVQSKGAGTTYLELQDKTEAFLELSEDYEKGAYISLLGDFKHESDEDFENKEGYVLVENSNGMMFLPTTIQGKLLIESLNSANKLWSQFYPFKNETFKRVMRQTLNTMPKTSGKKQRLQNKTFVLNEMIKYFYGSQELGFEINNQERLELLVEKEGNQSLAGYLKTQMDKYPAFASNRFISILEPIVNNSSKYSLVHTNNINDLTPLEEDAITNGIYALLNSPIKLDNRNGKPYNTNNLVADLIKYNYLFNGNKYSPTGFSKYIPLNIAKAIGITEETRKFNAALKVDDLDTLNKIFDFDANGVTSFTRQFAQNNPDKVKGVSQRGIASATTTTQIINGVSMIIPESFTVAETDSFAYFLSIKLTETPVNGKPYALYEYNFATRQYERIRVKGQQTISAYSADNIVKIPSKNPVPQTSVKFTNLETALSTIANGKLVPDFYKELATQLLPFIDPKTSITYTTFENKNNNGKYLPSSNEIQIADHLSSSQFRDEHAVTILKEYAHSITARVINKYFVSNTLSSGVITYTLKDLDNVSMTPQEIKEYNIMKRLNALHNEAKKALDPSGEFLKNFEDTNTLNSIKDQTINYGIVNIHEFVEMMLTSSDFQNALNEIPFKNTEDSILSKFWKLISDLLNVSIPGLKLNPESITAQSLVNIYDLLHKAEIAAANSTTEELSHSDIATGSGRKWDGVGKDFSEKVRFDITGVAPNNKDPKKAAIATDIIEFGRDTTNRKSSTKKYGEAAIAQGIPRNSGKYNNSTVAFTSTSGNNVATEEDINNTVNEILKVLMAGGSIIMDNKENRNSKWNKSGEGKVWELLMEKIGGIDKLQNISKDKDFVQVKLKDAPTVEFVSEIQKRIDAAKSSVSVKTNTSTKEDAKPITELEMAAIVTKGQDIELIPVDSDKKGYQNIKNPEITYERQSDYVKRVNDEDAIEQNDDLRAAQIRGNFVDLLARDIFNDEIGDVQTYIDEVNERSKADGSNFTLTLEDEVFEELIDQIVSVKNELENKGFTFYSQDIVVFKNFKEETNGHKGLAGVLDLLVKGPDNRLHIIDFKTKTLTAKNLNNTEVAVFDMKMFGDKIALPLVDKWGNQQTVYSELIDADIQSINVLAITVIQELQGTNVHVIGTEFITDSIAIKEDYASPMSDKIIQLKINETLRDKVRNDIANGSLNSLSLSSDELPNCI